MRRAAFLLVITILASASACGGDDAGTNTGPSAAAPSATGREATTGGTLTGGSGPFEVNVDSRTLSGECRGATVPGQPTFILEPGQGNDPSQLRSIADALQTEGLVCSYDRAGFGSSDPATENPIPINDVVSDLDAVLSQADIPGPYLLIGHSLGAMTVLLYAQQHPDGVAGIVSMNPGPTYQDWIRRLRPIVTPQELQDNEIGPLTGGVPEEPIDTRGSDALLEEPFPKDIPYTVMFAEDCGGGTDPYCNKVVDELEDTQRELAALGPEGRFISVKGAGHDIFLTDLDEVLAAIDDVLHRSASSAG
jgi:pimeloyl-ACP methyl ester carboxylesterase